MTEARPSLLIIDENCREEYKLTRKQLPILQDMCQGLTSHEIALKRRISLQNANKHRQNILKKMAVSNSLKLIILLYEKQLAKQAKVEDHIKTFMDKFVENGNDDD